MTNEGGSISEDIIPNNQYSRDLDEFYSLIECLKTQHGGYKYLSNCSGGMDWPEKGVYFFFEPDEMRNGSTTLRVVRVGTHAVSRGSKSTLWGRLRTHKGRVAGGGNHRGSVFRKLVGYALIKRENYSGLYRRGNEEFVSFLFHVCYRRPSLAGRARRAETCAPEGTLWNARSRGVFKPSL